MKKVNLKFVSLRFIFMIIGVAIGLLIMAQLHTIPDRISNPATSTISLRETRDLLYKEQQELANEANELQKQNSNLQTELKQKSASPERLDQLEHQKALAGSTKLSGPGVQIKLDDSQSGDVSDESIVHAADLRDVLNLLWGSGAEAIAINDQRIVFTSAIDCVGNTVLINNTKISAPFMIKAIGDRVRMIMALDGTLNLADIKTRSRNLGLVFNYSGTGKILIDGFKGSFILNSDIQT